MASNDRELPPYEVCLKSSYTKENIDIFKEQLQNLEKDLLNIDPKDIRKPQLRRQIADLEEIIINFENTKPKPDIVLSLNDNIKLLSEYVELEKYNILELDIINLIKNSLFIDDNECSMRLSSNDFVNKIICKSDVNLFIEHLKKNFPKYSNAFEKHCTEASIKMFRYSQMPNSGNDTFDTLLSLTKTELQNERIKAINRRKDIKTYIDETQLNFNKNLSNFIENIIDEKTQMEDRILELEGNINKLVKVVYAGRGEKPANFYNLN